MSVMSRLQQDLIKKVADGMDMDILARPHSHVTEMEIIETLRKVEDPILPDMGISWQMQIDERHQDEIAQKAHMELEGDGRRRPHFHSGK